jgi:hypothetical protein
MRSMMRSVRASSFVVGLAVDKLAPFRKAVVTELVVQLEARPFVAAASAGGSRLGSARFERRSAASSFATSVVSDRQRCIDSGGDRKVCERPLG